ncbi:MAG: cell division topological specificity factor MinE [Cyanobacteria bacterium]|jgi:cell division topological specificity factor|nr:cell division topological specificity factor MinE [Cyanobacteriota bacterium]
MGWLNKLFHLDILKSQDAKNTTKDESQSGETACNRLKLVLMHDRTQLSPTILENMRDELVEVISRYVEIDKTALELNLESESNTIALVANIPVLRSRAVS